MYVTIRDVLNIKSIEGIRLVAGEKGLRNVVSNVNMLDNPDTFDWLVAGELLLTTGYIFKDDEAFQKKLIQELYERNCAGLGMKIRRYFDEIPQVMLDEANRLDFPIIEIPYVYSLSDISNVVVSALYGNTDSILKKGILLHDTLTKVALRGGELSDLCATLVSLIHNPLVLLDSRFRLLSYSDYPDNPYPLLDNLTLVHQEQVFDEAFRENLPVSADAVKKSIKAKYRFGEHEVICRVIPVMAIKKIYGYIVVFETVKKLTEIDYIALEHGATVIALERIKAREVEEAQHRIRRDFFDDLLSGRINSVSSLTSMAEVHGLDPSSKYYCVLTKVGELREKEAEEGWKDSTEQMKQRSRMVRVVDQAILAQGQVGTSISRNHLIISFIRSGLTEAKDRKTKSIELGQAIYDALKAQVPEADIHVGIGKAYEVLSISRSFKEAQEAVNIEGMLLNRHRVVHFENYRIFNLLSSDISKEKLVEFYENTVQRLVEYDRENHTSLVESLEGYFRHNGNVSEASKELYIHRNTFIYRIDKIKSILDTDLKDSEELLELQLGLKIMNYLRLNKEGR
jgi:purine catabolism regulator